MNKPEAKINQIWEWDGDIIGRRIIYEAIVRKVSPNEEIKVKLEIITSTDDVERPVGSFKEVKNIKQWYNNIGWSFLKDPKKMCGNCFFNLSK